jgi:phosphoserine aminotransferase
MKLTYFTPGPAELYPTVEQHVRSALDEQIGSISHRSAQFRKIYQHADEQLRTLLNVPKTHAILLTGSATEVWERVLMNCVEHESFHLVNGAFSQKFYDFALELGKYAHRFEKAPGEGFDYGEIMEHGVPDYAELVCVTVNETATGAQMRTVDVHKFKRSHRSKLFCVDMVSSAPYHDIDFELIDSAFFSVQKAFGLPAGLGVWIVNEKCLDKAERLRRSDCTIGTYHSLPTLWKNYKNFETPETPNVWNLYLLGKVAEDFNRIGIENLRKETDAKAKLLYGFLEKDPRFEPAVRNPVHRSATVVVANVKTGKPADVLEKAKKAGFIVGGGYGGSKDRQIRIANFPATSPEQVERLIEVLAFQ